MHFMFRYPMVLWGIAAVPVIVWIIHRFRKESSVVHPYTHAMKEYAVTAHGGQSKVLPFLRTLVLSLILVALAQPLGSEREVDYSTEGVDIILALDISGSMRAEDFQPDNRLSVAKEEAERFIRNRKTDRIGLVVFASKSYTQCPLTTDYDILIELLRRVQTGLIKDGTAIGLAIANAANRLTASDAKSKVIILLTDGENNSGQIDPFTAAEMAKTLGIRIYTIGVGRGGLVPYPVIDPVFGKVYRNIKLDVDEEALKEIARITGGLYFRARDRKGLREIYDTIDGLEKTKISVTEYINYEQLFQYPLLFAFIIFLLELFLRYTMYLRVP